MRVTICNSPPQSGKDAFVQYLAQKHQDVLHLEFKTKLIALTKEIYFIDDEQWESIYTNELKDIPMALFENKSPRQALIYVSEKVIKPKFGKDYFGKAAAHSLCEDKINMFSDGGFYDEMKVVVDACGADNTFILDFQREGKNFKQDSRGYVNIKNVERFSFNNNGTLEDLYEFADGYYEIVKHSTPTVQQLSEIADQIYSRRKR